ncbi:PTS transporter subunit EIIB, partial [Klebsiella pneumoniae]|nr:PTS transporter subunit EIIB [Klebsiella pneumoniae]
LTHCITRLRFKLKR